MRSYTFAKGSLFPGRFIAGKYRVLNVLGRGGMGVVCEAEQLDTGARVALKFLREDVESDMQPNERFAREARLAARLTSPHTCTLYGVDHWELGPFIVMELLNGRPLSSVIVPNKPIGAAEAVRIAYEACLALGEAHSFDIVHRDIKPGNLFLAWTPQQRVITKVLDFGVAKIPTQVITESGGKSLTDAALLLGTPAYVAPEQLTNSKLVTAAADVWALGVLLYEMLSGRLPFFSPLVPRLLVMIARDDPPPLESLVPNIEKGLAEVVHRCLVKPLTERFSSAQELGQALEPWLDRNPQLLEPLLREASLRPLRRSSSPPPGYDSADINLRLAPTSITAVPDSLGPHTAARRAYLEPARRALKNKAFLGIAVGVLVGLAAAARTTITGSSNASSSTDSGATIGRQNAGRIKSDIAATPASLLHSVPSNAAAQQQKPSSAAITLRNEVVGLPQATLAASPPAPPASLSSPPHAPNHASVAKPKPSQERVGAPAINKVRSIDTDISF